MGEKQQGREGRTPWLGALAQGVEGGACWLEEEEEEEGAMDQSSPTPWTVEGNAGGARLLADHGERRLPAAAARQEEEQGGRSAAAVRGRRSRGRRAMAGRGGGAPARWLLLPWSREEEAAGG
jgi:hypothetical protein